MPDALARLGFQRPDTGVLLRALVIIGTGAASCAVTFFLVIGRDRIALFGLLAWCVIAGAAVAFERYRNKAVRATPPIGPDWIDTGERVIEPGSRLKVAVYYRIGSGQRAYVRVE
jgi:hypothetical protein